MFFTSCNLATASSIRVHVRQQHPYPRPPPVIEALIAIPRLERVFAPEFFEDMCLLFLCVCLSRKSPLGIRPVGRKVNEDCFGVKSGSGKGSASLATKDVTTI